MQTLELRNQSPAFAVMPPWARSRPSSRDNRWCLGPFINDRGAEGKPGQPSKRVWPLTSIGKGTPVGPARRLALLALEDGDTVEARRYVEGLRETPSLRGL
jgi:hypothetical protein